MFKRNKKEKKDPETIKLEKRIERERKSKMFMKQADKFLLEANKKLEMYREIALKAKESGNKTQLLQAVKYIKFIQMNISKFENLKMQLDMAKMMSGYKGMLGQFMDSMIDFTDSLKQDGVNEVELSKALTRFNLESEKLNSQVSILDEMIDESEGIFSEILDTGLDISDDEIDKVLGIQSAPQREKTYSDNNIDELDKLLQDLK